MKSRCSLATAAAALAMWVAAATGSYASELIYAQANDSQSTYGPSRFWGEPLTNSEIADDFEVIGTIDRVVAGGFIIGTTPQWQGVFVRFYEYKSDGTPGMMQRQVHLLPGDPDLTVNDVGGIDIRLAEPFLATGRHFVTVQPHVNYWYWWSANSGAPRGQPYFFRDLAAGQTEWQHGDAQPFSEPNADVEFALYGTVSSPGTISSLSASVVPQSGYLEIFGSNFGGSGQVKVGGADAPVADWTSTRIVAYVPELAPTGSATVEVITAGGTSNALPLSVVPRVADGIVNWRLRLDGSYSRVRPARGPDGTVYVVDVDFHLYAVTPDGGIKWIARGAGNKGLAVGPDGTIYTGSESDITAFRPDGSVRWTFVQEPRAFILIGPSVGPDGNVYGVGTSGMGVFSLTPEGSLRWTNPENYRRPIVDYGEIAFGPNDGEGQLYFYANDHVRALRCSDGASVFTLPVHGKPVVSPLDGSVHILNSAYSPDGELLWAFTFPNFTSPSIASLAADGTHYVVNSTNTLYALEPNGSERWHRALQNPVGAPNVDPTNSLVVLPRSGPLNEPGFIQALGVDDQQEAWRVILPAEETAVFNPWTGENGFQQYVDTHALFEPDGSTVYFVTAIATGELVTDRSFLYSIAANGVQPVLTDVADTSRGLGRVTITPNPSLGAMMLRFELRATETVRLRIHDVAGRLVREIGPMQVPAGPHAVTWDGRDLRGELLPAGVFLVKMSAGGRETTSKVLRLR